MTANAQWIDVCALEAIPQPGALEVRIGEHSIALVRTSEDRIFALENRCPHKGGPLADGIVSGQTIICPLHGWRIRLDDGCAEPPDEGCTTRYEVELRQGRVWLRWKT